MSMSPGTHRHFFTVVGTGRAWAGQPGGASSPGTRASTSEHVNLGTLASLIVGTASLACTVGLKKRIARPMAEVTARKANLSAAGD